jgi:hydroxypyruvate isomerase
MEGDLVRALQEAKDHIGHIHTAGNPGRHELDETQEIYWPAVARAISDIGYTGFVSHEFFPLGDRVAALRQAWQACSVPAQAAKGS